MELLANLSKYGIIDIFFGVGIPTFLWALLVKKFPKNFNRLHVSISEGPIVQIPPKGEKLNSMKISLRNSGSTNLYVARAYFKSSQKKWFTLFLWDHKTELGVHPASDRIADKGNAFELKFSGEPPYYFTEFEVLIKPGGLNGVWTWLALSIPISDSQISEKRSGTLYIEYATQDFQGLHVVQI